MADKDYHAKLVIHDLGTMNGKVLSNLIKWLEAKAEELNNCNPEDYSKRYTSRLMKKGK